MPDLRAVAERDRWCCWLCGEPVPAGARPGDPNAPTVDHVVPRSRGGHGRPDNLRLAHRRCNQRRSSAAPVLTWPARLRVIDGADLWRSLRRLARRPGSGEVVALCADAESAAEAAGWVCGRAEDLQGGSWAAEVDDLGGVPAVRLRRVG